MKTRWAGRRAVRCRPAQQRASVGVMNTPHAGVSADPTASAGPSLDAQDRARLRVLADEQAALRRVAALVGSGTGPADLFSAVADELGRLIGAEATFVSSVDYPSVAAPGASPGAEGYITVRGFYGRVSAEIEVGFRVKLHPRMISTV